MNYIKELISDDIVLAETGQRIPLSNTYAREFKDLTLPYLGQLAILIRREQIMLSFVSGHPPNNHSLYAAFSLVVGILHAVSVNSFHREKPFAFILFSAASLSIQLALER